MRPATLSVLSVIVAGAVGAAIWLAGMAQDCHARWSRSGFTYEWRDAQCMVLAGSRWLPEQAVSVWIKSPDGTSTEPASKTPVKPIATASQIP